MMTHKTSSANSNAHRAVNEGFNLDIYVKEGAGAFVCGEETALIASVEGERGMPRKRPPFPAESGLWRKPTNINNVETFCYVPYIINEGIEEFKKTSNTKLFSVLQVFIRKK